MAENLPPPDFGPLQAFIVRAKARAYVGEGAKTAPSQQGSHDHAHAEPKFAYRDSYVGGTDFLGQEIVTFEGEPVWAMNYYGRILRADLYDGARAARVIRASLAKLYASGRFLGPSREETDDGIYLDSNDGDFRNFHGRESIELAGVVVYELVYHGGLVKR